MLLCEAGHLAGAEAGLVRLLQRCCKSYIAIGVDPALRGFPRYSLGVVYRDQGKPAEAERQWRAVLAERPEHHPPPGSAWWSCGWRTAGGRRRNGWHKSWKGRPAGRWTRRRCGPRCWRCARDYAAGPRPARRRPSPRRRQALWPRLVLTHVLLQEGGDPAGMERALRDVLALDPNHAQTRKNLAVLLKKQGQGLQPDLVAQ